MSTDLDDQTAGALLVGARERRRSDRRRQVLRGLLLGSFHARRRTLRRAGEQALAAIDWHHPQWLATAILILLFSGADALLTLVLIERHGAYEVNPLMRPLLLGSALAFAVAKVGLTAGGVVLLTLLARIRAFGRLSGGLVLYALLAGYGALILYEFSLLDLL
jgi:Domain of unknown function (DUF5658)